MSAATTPPGPDVDRKPSATTLAARAQHGAVEIRAVRTATPPNLDGRIDEAAWRRAPVFDRFVESFPREGASPSERTELRVLYDDSRLYVAVTCFDSQPALIHRGLGRRDGPPASDLVTVYVDAGHDHRTALAFTINAGGVLKDSIIVEDTEASDDWDGMWDGAASLNPAGWSAELVIPLRLLRTSGAAEQWGFGVRRELARTHAIIDTALIPRNANALVSRLSHVVGLRDVRHRRDWVLTPYVASRLILRPQYSDPARPDPRLTDPTLDVGADVHAHLARGVHLVGTINPDFGQVEADEIILNLTTFEEFFPEKRPFFTQGMELFQSVGAREGLSPQMLFYSRRIGLDVPILGAAKLTGTFAGGALEVGLLDAFVSTPADPAKEAALEAGVPFDEENPDRRYRPHGARPLHLGPNSELPAQAISHNFVAAVARGRVAPGALIGGAFAAAIPLGETCDPAAGLVCPTGGDGFVVDWNLGDGERRWVALGQAGVSHAIGGVAEGRTLVDGTVIRPGDVGAGGYLRAGKLGGEPLRLELGYEYASPQLDFNPTGFQRTQNEQLVSGKVQLARSAGLGPLRDTTAGVEAKARFTTDGRRLSRGHSVSGFAEALLPGFHRVRWDAGVELDRVDVREIEFLGIPYRRQPFVFGAVTLGTDPSRLLGATLDVYLDRTVAREPVPSRVGGEVTAGMTVRPRPWMQTELEVGYQAINDSPEFLAQVDAMRFQFGKLTPRFLSLTLRQLVVLRPRLTLQAYAQLFGGWGRYGPFYEAISPDGGTIDVSDLMPSDAVEDPSFETAALNVNLVARWEYRLGSTLFLVYTRAQEQLPGMPGRIDETFYTSDLLRGAAVDVFLMKWSYSWDR